MLNKDKKNFFIYTEVINKQTPTTRPDIKVVDIKVGYYKNTSNRDIIIDNMLYSCLAPQVGKNTLTEDIKVKFYNLFNRTPVCLSFDIFVKDNTYAIKYYNYELKQEEMIFSIPENLIKEILGEGDFEWRKNTMV